MRYSLLNIHDFLCETVESVTGVVLKIIEASEDLTMCASASLDSSHYYYY
eukprot:m.684018 g.684018  ORF g.684018 m.684018 type:complete len:50 (-) comp22832_c0_seq12:95-244(-)